ncbi:MAG: hypothetical protein ACLGPL_10905 [Acidobacteriota bacterium]
MDILEDKKRLLGCLLIYVIFFCALYATVTFCTYGYADDYDFVKGNATGTNFQVVHMVRMGRPLSALVYEAFQFKTSVASLASMRLMGVLGVALLAFGIFHTLAKAGLDRIVSFLVAVLICTMPPFQVFVGWAICSYFPLVCIMSGLAALLIQRGMDGSNRALALHCLGSVALMGVCVTLYQPAAMFFWFAGVFPFFFKEMSERERIRLFAAYLLVFTVAGLMALFSAKVLPSIIYPDIPPMTERVGLTKDIFGKAVWFVVEPLINALNFFNVKRRAFIGLATGSLIGLGLLLYPQKNGRARLFLLGIAGAFVVLSYCPNLLSVENWASYRSTVALSATLVLFLSLAILTLLDRFAPTLRFGGIKPAHIIFFLLACTSSYMAAKNLNNLLVFPNTMEYRYLKSHFRDVNPSEVESICARYATWSDNLAPYPRYDDFGVPSSSFNGAFESMVYDAIREANPALLKVPIRFIPYTAEYEPPPKTLYVDMRKVRFLK